MNPKSRRFRLGGACADRPAGARRRHRAGRLGLGATGHAVGEVCFNTAMTGYQEILTDPSYAGQIITFTFPHIGNVGTNEEDIETVNMAATPGARGVILQTAITAPSNYRAEAATSTSGSSAAASSASPASTPARSPASSASKGMPNAVIAHAAVRALRSRCAQAGGARMAGPGRHGPRADGDVGPALHLGRDAVGMGQGLRPAGARRNSTWWRSTTASSATSCASSPARAARSRWCRRRPRPRTSLALEPDGVFLSNGPGDPAATGEYAVPVIRGSSSAACRPSASASATRCSASRSAPRP